MRKQKIKIVQSEEKPIAAEIIAQSIVDISDAIRDMNKTRLSRKAIVALIHEESKISRRQIEIVLNNLDRLEEIWLKKKL